VTGFGQGAALRAEWDRWNPSVRLDTLDSPHRSLVHQIVGYVRRAQYPGRRVAVLITEVRPRRPAGHAVPPGSARGCLRETATVRAPASSHLHRHQP
jgi:hypothetical protein